MDRYTYVNNGRARLYYGAHSNWDDGPEADVLQRAIQRLYEYENTNLTPAEVEKLKMLILRNRMEEEGELSYVANRP